MLRTSLRSADDTSRPAHPPPWPTHGATRGVDSKQESDSLALAEIRASVNLDVRLQGARQAASPLPAEAAERRASGRGDRHSSPSDHSGERHAASLHSPSTTQFPLIPERRPLMFVPHAVREHVATLVLAPFRRAQRRRVPPRTSACPVPARGAGRTFSAVVRLRHLRVCHS